jgi:hypothetical protein
LVLRLIHILGVVLKALDSLRAMSALSPDLALIMLERVFLDTPNLVAKQETVMPNGSRKSLLRTRPGWGGW